MANRYSGVIAFSRSDLEVTKRLKDSEFRLWLMIICQLGWDDKRHPEQYGKARLSQKELADLIGWQESKTSRILKSLLLKTKDFYQAEDGTFVCIDYDRFKTSEAYKRAKEAKAMNLEQAKLDLDYQRKLASHNSKMKEVVPEMQKQVPKLEEHTEDNVVTTPIIADKSLVAFSEGSLNRESYIDSNILLECGFIEKGLTLPCICGSGLNTIDCCAVLLMESLKNVSS